MSRVQCDGRPVEVGDGESLLEAVLRAGVPLPHSCRVGACQSCLVKATTGTPPAGQIVGRFRRSARIAATRRLDEAEAPPEASSRLFLPNKTEYPSSAIEPPSSARVETPATGEVGRSSIIIPATLTFTPSPTTMMPLPVWGPGAGRLARPPVSSSSSYS